mgnify:CR=1 FL=1
MNSKIRNKQPTNQPSLLLYFCFKNFVAMQEKNFFHKYLIHYNDDDDGYVF